MPDPIYDSSGGAKFENGQWSMVPKSPGAGAAGAGSGAALGGGGGYGPTANDTNPGAGGGFDQFGADKNWNIGTNPQGYEASQAPGADGRDANGLPTYYQNVQASTPGGPGAQDINNPRFNEFLSGNSTNTLSDFLKTLGFDNTISDTGFAGGPSPTSPQHNINVNGNIMNAGLIQQRLNNNKNPDGSFNLEYFKRQMQDEINSNGIGGSRQVADQAGNPGYGMGGTVGLTNTGINYDNGQMGGYAANRGGNATQAQQQQTNPNAGQNFGASLGRGQQSPGRQMSSGMPNYPGMGQGGYMPSIGSSGSMAGGGMSRGGWPGMPGQMGGQMYGGGMYGAPRQRPPQLGMGYGGFGGGMQNSMYYPQSEPNLRPGMQGNFQNAGQAPAWGGMGMGQGGYGGFGGNYGGAPNSMYNGMMGARQPMTQPYYGSMNTGGSYNGFQAMY